MVVAITFSVTFTNNESAKTFLSAFRKLHSYIIANEPGTLLYELHQCFHEGKPVPFKYIILERYSSRFDLYEVHAKSAALEEFLKLFNTLDVAAQSLETLENDEIKDLPPPELLTGNDASQAEKRHPLLRKGVLVFGGSRNGLNPAYTEEAESLGMLLARRERRTLVYGGGNYGMMGTVAKGVEAGGGMVISVIPRALIGLETSSKMIGDLVYHTDTMSERKSIMFACADVVVALPGGIGTFDELLEVLTLFQLGAYCPKIGLLNVNKFYDPFVSLLKHLVAEQFLTDDVFSSFVIASTADELLDALNKLEAPQLPGGNLVWHARP